MVVHALTCSLLRVCWLLTSSSPSLLPLWPKSMCLLPHLLAHGPIVRVSSHTSNGSQGVPPLPASCATWYIWLLSQQGQHMIPLCDAKICNGVCLYIGGFSTGCALVHVCMPKYWQFLITYCIYVHWLITVLFQVLNWPRYAGVTCHLSCVLSQCARDCNKLNKSIFLITWWIIILLLSWVGACEGGGLVNICIKYNDVNVELVTVHANCYYY